LIAEFGKGREDFAKKEIDLVVEIGSALCDIPSKSSEDRGPATALPMHDGRLRA
jgi:hypothetical protein